MNYLFDGLMPKDRDPDAPCILRPDGRVERYRDVEAMSARFAAALAAEGVRPGDRVLVQVEKSPEAMGLYLGCIRSGAVFLPLNTAYTPAEVGYFIGDARPALIVSSPARAGVMAELAGPGVPVVTLDETGGGSLAERAAAMDGRWTDIPRGPGDLATILYTSGTTGRSKGAMLSHANLRANAEALVETWRYRPDDVLIHALPIFHAHGLYVGINVTLMAGASMIFLPRFDADEVIERMGEATVLMGVPTFYTRLLDRPGLTAERAKGMRLFISGSAPLLAETHAAFAHRTGHAILERYGMTETSMNTSNPYEGARVPGSVGLPLPGVEIRIADRETGAVLGTGAVGIVEVKGPNVFSGYWNMPEKTAEDFRPDGFFVTGDIGRIDENGYLWILGRAKDIVITGGYNVYPKEVELVIDELPGVLESAVIGVPHADFGQAVVAVVVPEPGASLSESAILDHLRPVLAGYKLPKRVVFVEELPRNTMGKVQKNLLQRDHAELFEAAGAV